MLKKYDGLLHTNETFSGFKDYNNYASQIFSLDEGMNKKYPTVM